MEDVANIPKNLHVDENRSANERKESASVACLNSYRGKQTRHAHLQNMVKVTVSTANVILNGTKPTKIDSASTREPHDTKLGVYPSSIMSSSSTTESSPLSLLSSFAARTSAVGLYGTSHRDARNNANNDNIDDDNTGNNTNGSSRVMDQLVRERDALMDTLLLSSSNRSKENNSKSRSRDNASKISTNVSEKTKSSYRGSLENEVANDGHISSRRKKSLPRSDDEEGRGRHQHHHEQEQGLTATASEGTPRRGKTQRKEGRERNTNNSNAPPHVSGSGHLGRIVDRVDGATRPSASPFRRSSSSSLSYTCSRSSSSCSSDAPSVSFTKRGTSTSTRTATATATTQSSGGGGGQECLLVVSSASVDCGCECHAQMRAISTFTGKRKDRNRDTERGQGYYNDENKVTEEEESCSDIAGVCCSKSDEIKVVQGNESVSIKDDASSSTPAHHEAESERAPTDSSSNSGEIIIMIKGEQRDTSKLLTNCNESRSKSEIYDQGADDNAIAADFSSSSSTSSYNSFSSPPNSLKETQSHVPTEAKQENDFENENRQQQQQQQQQHEEEHQELCIVNSSAHSTMNDDLVRDERNTSHHLVGSEPLLGKVVCREEAFEKEKSSATEMPRSESKTMKIRALATKTQNKHHSAKREAKSMAAANTKGRNTERSTAVEEDEAFVDENTTDRAVSVYSWRNALHGAIKSVTKGRAVSNTVTVSRGPTPAGYQKQRRGDDQWEEEEKVSKSKDRDAQPASAEFVVKRKSGTSETPLEKTSRRRVPVPVVEEEMPKLSKKSRSDPFSVNSESGVTVNAVTAAAEVEILTTKSDALSKENTFLKSMLRTARDELRGALEEHSRYITTTAGQERNRSPLGQRNSTQINSLTPADRAHHLDSASISTKRSRNPSKISSSSSLALFSRLVDPIIDYYENENKHKAVVHEATLAFQRDVIGEMLLLQKREREEERQRGAADDKTALLLMEQHGTGEMRNALLLQNTSKNSLPRREEGRKEALPQHSSSYSSSGSVSSNSCSFSSPEKKKEKRYCGYVYPVITNPHPSHPSPSSGKEGCATRLSRSLGIHRELLRGMAPSVCDSSSFDEGRCSEYSIIEEDGIHTIKDQMSHEGMALHSLASSSSHPYHTASPSFRPPIVDLLERENTLLRSQLKRSERSLELTRRVLPIRSRSRLSSSESGPAMMLATGGKKGQWSPNGGIGVSAKSYTSTSKIEEEFTKEKGGQCCSVMKHPHLHSSVFADTDAGGHVRAGRSLVILGGPVVSHYYDASGQLVTPTETFRKVMNRAGTMYVNEVKKSERLAKDKIDIAENLETSERARAAAEAQRDGAMRLVADLTRSLEMSKNEVMRARAQRAAARGKRQSSRDIKEEEDLEGEKWGTEENIKISTSPRPAGMNDSIHAHHNNRSVQHHATNAHREGGTNVKAQKATRRATKEQAGEEGFSLDELQQLFEKGCTFGEEGQDVRQRGRGGGSGSVFEVSECFSEQKEEEEEGGNTFDKGSLVRGGYAHLRKRSATPTYLAVGAAKRLVKAVSDMVKEVGTATEPEIVSIEKTYKEIARKGEPSPNARGRANNNTVVPFESSEPSRLREVGNKKEIEETHTSDRDAARKRLREKHLPAVVGAVREVSAEFVYMRSREQQYLNLIVDDEMAEKGKGKGKEEKEKKEKKEGGQHHTEEEESTVAVARDIAPKTVSGRGRGPPPSSSLYRHSRPLPNHPIHHTAAPSLLTARESRPETKRLVSVADSANRSGTDASASTLLAHQQPHAQQRRRGFERQRDGSADSVVSSSLPSEITDITNTSRITRGAVSA